MSDTPNNDYHVEPGLRLKMIRERLQLRYRDVEEGSTRIAEHFKNEELIVSLGRLSDIEHKGTVPNLYWYVLIDQRSVVRSTGSGLSDPAVTSQPVRANSG